MIDLLRKLKQLLPLGRFARNVAVLAGGTALGQAIVVLASLILTRLYTPEDFGVLAVYSSLLGILSVIASLRYELAIPLPEKEEDATAVTVLSLVIVLGMSFLVGLGVELVGERIVQWVHFPALEPYLWFLPVGVLLVGSYQVFTYWAVRRRAFYLVSRTKFNQGLMSTFVQISLGLWGSGKFGLLLGHIFGQAAGVTTLATLAGRESGSSLQSIRPANVWKVAKRYMKFPIISSFSGLMNVVGLRMPTLMLAVFYGAHVAGWFSLGQRIIGIPMTLIGSAVGQVYLAEVSKLVREGPEVIKRHLVRTSRRLLLIGIGPMVIIVVGGPALFAWIFGSQWEEVGLYIRLLSITLLLQLSIAPFAQTLNVIGRQELLLVWDLVRLFIVMATFLLARNLGWPHYVAVGIYSGSYSILLLMLYGLIIHAVNGLSNRGGKRHEQNS